MILERQEKQLNSLANIRYRLEEIALKLFTQPPQVVGKNPATLEPPNQMVNVSNNLDTQDRLLEQIDARLNGIEEQLGLMTTAVAASAQLGQWSADGVRR